MSKKRFKSKSILTGGATFLTGTVLSSSFASADWNFSLGKDDSKGVYYVVSDSKSCESETTSRLNCSGNKNTSPT